MPRFTTLLTASPLPLARTDSAPAPGAEGPDSESEPVRPLARVWPPHATPRARHTPRALPLARLHTLPATRRIRGASPRPPCSAQVLRARRLTDAHHLLGAPPAARTMADVPTPTASTTNAPTADTWDHVVRAVAHTHHLGAAVALMRATRDLRDPRTTRSCCGSRAPCGAARSARHLW